MPVFGNVFNKFKHYGVLNFAKTYPRTYLVLVSLLAITGFFYLLVFPVGVLISIQQIAESILGWKGMDSMINLSAWFGVMLLCAGITYRIATIKYCDPDGTELNDKIAPRLIKMINDTEQSVGRPKISKVLLSTQYELNIVKVPLFAFPVVSRNVLVVGFPLLQSMSLNNFQHLLTHKFNQYAKREIFYLNILNNLRDSWTMTASSFRNRGKLGDQFIHWFFALYGKIYEKLSIYAVQLDVLKGDDLALNQVNDSDYFIAIEEYYLSRYYLRTFFWPKILKLMKEKSMPPEKIKPFSNLPNALKQGFTEQNIHQWLNNLTYEKRNNRDCDPPFADRMRNIGYTKTLPVNKLESPSSVFIFSNKYNNVIEFMDKIWAKSFYKKSDRKRKNKSKQPADKVTGKLRPAQ